MKTIQVMPVSGAGQYCIRAVEMPFGDDPSPVQALSIVGGSSRLMKRRAMLIISRLQRVVHAEDEWLSAVRKAVDYSLKKDCVIVTSVVSLGWNYTTWYAAQLNASLWIVFPPGNIDKLRQVLDKVVQNLGISEKSTTFFMPILNGSLSKSARLKMRDQSVFSFAHNNYLNLHEKNSSWSEQTSRSMKLNSKFSVDYPVKHRQCWQSLLSTDQLNSINLANKTQYLVHWTRGAFGPWRGDSDADYFNALTSYKLGNPRDGYNTLVQVIRSGILRGSGKMIKGAEPVISFSDSNFGKVFKLIEYINALGHWNYESYGIGFPQELLESIGAKCVSYGSRDEYQQLSDVKKPYYQYSKINHKTGKGSSNWTAEGEWRLLGDLDFISIIEKAVIIVPTKTDANNIYQEVGAIPGLKRENIHYLTANLDI